MKKFTMEIPKGIATAVSRRHNGREDITRDERIDGCVQMQLLWNKYQKAQKHLDWIYNVFWVEERIEDNYGSKKFYNAHRRLRNAQNKVKQLHKDMFYLLVYTDGNQEQFGSGALEAEECYLSFMKKYAINKN